MSPKAGPLCLLTGLLAVHSTLAAPNRRLLKGVDPINDVIVFDAPVFTDSSSGSMRAAIPAFVSRRQPNDETVIAQGVSALLKQMGVDVGSSINNLADRVKLFAAGSISGKEVDLQVQACNKQVSAHCHVSEQRSLRFSDSGQASEHGQFWNAVPNR